MGEVRTWTAAEIDRACGVVIASAVGDALGAGYEFESAAYDGWPRMIGGGLGDFEPGEWTDDTSQAVPIAEVAARGMDLRSEAALDAIAGRFAQWYAENPPDVGVQTSAVLRAAGRHPSAATMRAAATAVHERSGRSAGNGSLMRTGPVALAHLHDPTALVEAAMAVSALTHHDPLAGEGAALWCLMIRHAVLHGEFPSADQVVSHLPDPERWRDLLAEAESQPPSTFRQNAWVVGALQAAWSAIHHTPVPEQLPARHLQHSLATAIGIGHDTDTVAAIAGALLGARWGLSAVPQEWLRVLHGWPGLTGEELSRLAFQAVQAGAVSEGAWPLVDRIDYAHWSGVDTYVAHPLVDGVFLGGAGRLADLPDEVDAVVSLCRLGRDQIPGVRERVVVRLIDSIPEDNPHLDFVIDDAARTVLSLREEGKTVYLHCAAAQSRTPTVATQVAVLAGHDHDAALAAVLEALPGANPRPFFLAALQRLAGKEPAPQP